MKEARCSSRIEYKPAAKPDEVLGILKCEPCIFDKRFVDEKVPLVKKVALFKEKNCIKEIKPINPQI